MKTNAPTKLLLASVAFTLALGCKSSPTLTANGNQLSISTGAATAIQSFFIAPADNISAPIYSVQGSFDFKIHTFALHPGTNAISTFEVAHGNFQLKTPAGLTTFTLEAEKPYIAELCADKCVQTQFTLSASSNADAQYPARPTTPPPPFTLYHQYNDIFTLVTIPTATDTQIEAIIWQLRTAAHTRTFDKIGIPQKLVDARDPMAWFHIYRGPKCADEKYTDGKLPCGDSYHASGDYTFGGGTNNQWDDGALLHHTETGEDHETELWNPSAPPPSNP